MAVALWLTLPPLAAFAFSTLTSTHVYLDRYFLMDLPAAAVVLAAAVDAVRPAAVACVLLAVVAGARLAMIPSTYVEPDELSQAARVVLSGARSGDCITFDIPQTATTQGIATELEWYWAHGPADRVLPQPVFPPFSWSAAQRASFVEGSSSQTLTDVRASCRRVWFLVEPLPPGALPVYAMDVLWLGHGWPILVDRLLPEVRVLLVGPR